MTNYLLVVLKNIEPRNYQKIQHPRKIKSLPLANAA